MKNAKKFFAVLVVLALALSMVIPAAAEEGATITIQNAKAEQTYTIYKMADLVTYDVEAGTYSYKVAAGWKDFFTTQGIEVDGTDFILYSGSITDASTFAADAVAHAKKTAGVSAYASTTVGDVDAPVVFEVEPGYYCIDSTLGTKSAVYLKTNEKLTTLEKNSIPGITKTVYENSTQSYGLSNDASVGATVNFKITVATGEGVDSLKIVDVLSTGLKLDSDPVISGENVKGTLNIEKTSDNGFTATITGHDDNTTIDIVYTAIVTPEAVVETGIENTAELIYGENETVTPEVKTKTYTWSFNVGKVDANDNGLDGATFSIYATKADAEAERNPLTFTGAEGVYQYDSTGKGTVTVLESNGEGEYIINGVDSGSYYVREIDAPTGYNKTEEVFTATVTSDNKYNTDALTVEVTDPKVVNYTGTVLPSTGATGTAIFVAVGSVLVVAMFVLLIVRKRMTKLVYTK